MNANLSGVTPPVVVGYDGSPAADRAVAWAAREAAALRAPLQIVYARDLDDYDIAPHPRGKTLDPATGADDGPYAVCAHAADLARAAAGAAPVEVETFVEYASPVSALVALSRGAACVVLGYTHNKVSIVEELGRSIGLQVAAHAHCPVVVVPGGWDPEGRTPDGGPAPIVVGFDGSTHSLRAVEVAARTAIDAGTCLEVVTAWRPVPQGVAEGWLAGTTPQDVSEVAAQQTLAEGVALARSVGADAQGFHVLGRAVEVLHSAATTAQADRLVIGSRGRGGLAAILLGSVTHTMMRKTPVPLVIVRAVE